MEAGGVDDDDLAIIPVDNRSHATTRRLGDRRGDRDLFAKAGVEQGRLSSIGTPHQGDESAAKPFGSSRSTTVERCLFSFEHGVKLLIAQIGERIEFSHESPLKNAQCVQKNDAADDGGGNG